MQISEYQQWVRTFYQQRKWYQYDPFIRINFLAEELGEVSRAVRSLEIGCDRPDEAVSSPAVLQDNLIEELGDVLDNIFILADKYGLSVTDVLAKHQQKLTSRYSE